MYSDRAGLILGFHGCDETVRNKVILNETNLLPSTNSYDWLGHGTYFWLNSPDRALEFISHPRYQTKIEKPSVLGAVIDLKHCLDLLEYKNISLVKQTYLYLKDIMEASSLKLPQNITPPNSTENLIRELDCFVIESLHELTPRENQYDSVIAVFLEGDPLYQNAGFNEKNHIQICIRNPNCIKGYFVPRSLE